MTSSSRVASGKVLHEILDESSIYRGVEWTVSDAIDEGGMLFLFFH